MLLHSFLWPEFQRTQHLTEKETAVLNKYYNLENYDKAAVKRMSDAMHEVMDVFNECGE